MKYTLLQLTQDVLSSMDSDEINSISDTVESMQVVKVIKTVYDDIITRGDVTKSKVYFNLTASNDNTKPVLMYKPETIDRIDWLKYNTIGAADTDPIWTDIRYLPFEDFLNFTNNYTPSEADVDTMTVIQDGFIFSFHFKNDTPPQYYTTYDDHTVLFDAYDSAVDTTLQSVKTMGYGFKSTLFTEEDGWVPELQPNQFALLLNEAKSLAWAELKQSAHPKAEQTARRNWRHVSRARFNIPDGGFGSGAHPFDQLRNFGRK